MTVPRVTFVQLALQKIGRVFCRHRLQLIQRDRLRLYVRCPDCGLESVGFQVGGMPETKR